MFTLSNYCKKEETRKQYIAQMQEELLEGKRHLCCLPGCNHRRESTKNGFNRKKHAYVSLMIEYPLSSYFYTCN